MVGGYGFVVSDSSAGVSLMVAKGFVVSDSSVGVSFTVAMALLCQIAVRAYR